MTPQLVQRAGAVEDTDWLLDRVYAFARDVGAGMIVPFIRATADGTSCASSLRESIARTLEAQSTYSHAIDGRFKGGHITRHYGRPAERIHAIQLEMCLSTYVDEEPGESGFTLDVIRAAQLEPVLRVLPDACLQWKPDD